MKSEFESHNKGRQRLFILFFIFNVMAVNRLERVSVAFLFSSVLFFILALLLASFLSFLFAC